MVGKNKSGSTGWRMWRYTEFLARIPIAVSYLSYMLSQYPPAGMPQVGFKN